MAINQLGRIEGKDVFKLEKQGEIGLYRRLPPPKLHEFWVKNEANEAEIQIMGRGKTRNVQYRVCLTMIGSIAFIVHAYIHKGGKKSRQNEDDIKLAHKRAKEAHRQFGTDQR